jgi:glycosyltransferase involved in cell wall biosynthesis
MRLVTDDSLPRVDAARQKKKLLYLAVCDPDLEVTGVTVRMGAFVRHLGRFYDVTLVNMAGSGHRVDPAIEERFRDRDNRLGVTRRVRVDFSKSGYFLFSPRLFRAAARLLSQESFDYLLADYGLAAVYGKFLASRYRIPLIYGSMNVEYKMYLDQTRYDFRRALLTPYVYLAERAACRAAQLVVAISENDRQEYLKWIPSERIEVIPQGFDPEVWNPFYAPPPASPASVLFVGNFLSEHNRQAARKIVKEILDVVVRARPDVKFHLVGAAPPADLAGPNVECPGFVDDLAAYFRRAHLVIAPMPFSHGMSTKIVSGLAFGKTVLTTPEGAGAIPRKYRQLVVSPLEEFPERIVQLLSTSRPIDAGDFAALCEDFGWPSLMSRLSQRIEQSSRQPD